MISEAVEALVAGQGDLGDEQAVHAAAARRLAGLLDAEEVAPYAAAALARELRAVLAALVGSPPPGRGGVDEDELADVLRDLR